MPYLDLHDGRLYYEERGEGRALILLHGAWASHRWWRWQVPEFAGHYRVLAVDMRGHGRSTDLGKGYSIQGFASDLEMLLQGLGIREAAMVGWSMGGMIAIQYALQLPSKVKALVLLATRGHRYPAMRARILFQYLRSILHLLMAFTAPRKYDRTGASSAGENKGWVERETRKMLSAEAPEEVLRWMVSELIEHPRRNYLEIARGLWHWEAGEALKGIRAPTLILVGENDPWAPPRFSRLLHEAIPNSRLLVVEGQRHYMAMERPDLVNAAILRFLKEQGYL